MITKRFWQTTKRNTDLDGRMYNRVITDWEGWFLFGLLPLYIRPLRMIGRG